MNQYIKYFYNIDSRNILLYKNNYFFSDIYGNFFCFYNFTKNANNFYDINDIYKAYNIFLFLNKNHIYCHKIIPNIKSELFEYIDNDIYVLLMCCEKFDLFKKISTIDLEYFSKKLFMCENKNIIHWKELWASKIDYFEYQLNQFGFRHPILRESFGYYSGLAEIAIALQNSIKTGYYNAYKCVSHYRLTEDYTIFEFYNPLNFIIDNKERDFSEYCKSKFFKSHKAKCDDLINDILNYFIINKFENENVIMFFSRMLYISDYFDEFERIMNNNLSDDHMKININKIKKYEIFIKKLYFDIKKSGYFMPPIDWLEKY